MRVLHILTVLVSSFVAASTAYAQSEGGERAPAGRDVPAAPAVTEDSEVTQSVAIAVDAPRYISFQGYLEDGGSPVNGLHDFVFRLKDFPTAGITKWTEVQNDVQVTDGIYNVLLGSAQSLAAVDFNDDLWLSIEVDGGGEILPRPQIVASPYSLMSLEALDLRLPGEISGVANVDGTKLLTITNNGTGDVLRVQGSLASDGIEVSGVDLNAVEALSPGQHAFLASSPGLDGLHVSSAGDDGVEILNSDDDGIRVIEAGGFAFHFADLPAEINGNLLTSYVGWIENTGSTTSEDVLAIQTGTAGDPGGAANLIGFFDGDDELIGQIEGNGSGGVAYNTSGSDYAEYLPHLEDGSRFTAGDVVGVFNGKISRRTEGAQQVMVITDQAAVLGNAPQGREDMTGFESVSFIGQVPVRVTGPVNDGDYIVASGRNNGTAVAVRPEEIRLDDIARLVGKAWESSPDPATKRLNVIVGLDRTDVLEAVIRRQSEELAQQRHAIEELRKLVNAQARERAGS